MTLLLDLYSEIDDHLMEDEQPSIYFNEVSKEPTFNEFPLNMLSRLKQTNQSQKHHPEGNVWNHTMLVVDEAAKVKNLSQDIKVFMWAALLHDIGKPYTTRFRKGRITSYEHESVGSELAVRFLSEFKAEGEFIEKVAQLIRWHMQILFVVNNLAFADIKTMKKKTDINEVALIGLCDRLGRGHVNRREEEENIQKFIKICSSFKN